MMEGSSDMYLIERIWGGRAAEIEETKDLNLIVEVLQEIGVTLVHLHSLAPI